MNSLPFFHLHGENKMLKQALDESRHELFIVQADTLEIIYFNKKARQQSGVDFKNGPINISRLGTDYQLKSFRGLVSPLMNGSQTEVTLLTHHQTKDGKNYPVEVRITRNNIQGFDYLLLTVEDISEKVNLEKELKQKTAELKKLSFELDKFVYSASHDLLAPISTLKGLLQIEEKDQVKNLMRSAVTPDITGMMNKTVNKLERYIHDMIDFSRNMRQDVSGEAIDFTKIFNLTLDNLRFTEGFNNVNIQIEIDQTVEFYGDEKRMQMIFNNFVSNGIKYHNPGTVQPFVNISIKVNETQVTLVFKDNGIGISTESIDRIFEMFYRASASSYGSGLGLYIVKEVLKKVKGKIQVASVLGEGTEFLIEIPNKINPGSVHKRKKKVKPHKTTL